jgi:hypothetical protein
MFKIQQTFRKYGSFFDAPYPFVFPSIGLWLMFFVFKLAPFANSLQEPYSSSFYNLLDALTTLSRLCLFTSVIIYLALIYAIVRK